MLIIFFFNPECKKDGDSTYTKSEIATMLQQNFKLRGYREKGLSDSLLIHLDVFALTPRNIFSKYLLQKIIILKSVWFTGHLKQNRMCSDLGLRLFCHVMIWFTTKR